MRTSYIIGIDEVGRGALAGPIVVVAAMIPSGLKIAGGDRGPLKDSKKLSPKKREAWSVYLRAHPAIAFAAARVYPRGIERMNISRAANLAAQKACGRLGVRGWRGSDTAVYLDGGLYLKSKAWQKVNAPRARTVIKGDETIAAIAIASIIAKVSRDRFMRRLSKKWPGYAFDVHKGYGTKGHYRALEKNGPTPIHRLTFLPLKYRMKQ